jgi:hypothetical protein
MVASVGGLAFSARGRVSRPARTNACHALGAAPTRAIARAEGGTVAERLWIALVGAGAGPPGAPAGAGRSLR